MSNKCLNQIFALLSRSIRYFYRNRICYSIPIIIIEIIIPLLIIIIIILFSNYLISDSSLFDLNENEKCSQNSIDEINEDNCLNIPKDFYSEKYFQTNIYFRYLNKDDLFDQLISRFQTNKLIKSCSLKLMNSSSDIFDNKSLNIIVDIKEFSSKIFEYDLIIPMSNKNKYNNLFQNKIDKSFFNNYQHPSEQIVF
jgi:hypothetical protein